MMITRLQVNKKLIINNSRILIFSNIPYIINRQYSNSIKHLNSGKLNITTSSLFSKDGILSEHINFVTKRYAELSIKLTEELSNSDLTKLSKEYAELARIVNLVENRNEHQDKIDGCEEMEKEEISKGSKADNEMLSMISMELEESKEAMKIIEENMVKTLTPKDDADDRGIVIEVRAGTGGDEASLFASEIFKMYQKFSENMGFRWEEMSISKSELGGFKEAQAVVNGDQVYRYFKFESGTHRVQRIPVNDVKIQTSAATVLVLPEANDTDVELRTQDIRIDVYRSGGAGGQSVNKTESAVRMTHIPTGCVVAMQDERSQIQNRAKCLKYLRAKVFDVYRRQAQAERADERAGAKGTGERSDKIRTYNFPQDRVTDHRISLSINGVERVLAALSLNTFVDALIEEDDSYRLQSFLSSLEKKRK